MVTRRSFLATSATALSATRAMGANDRVRVGLLGAGGRGSYIARTAKEFGNADIAALSEIYEPNGESARAALNPSAAVVRDFRAILDRKDIDAVIVGAPDHWHVPMTIAAVQAGKDVYVEKPLTHSIEEGAGVIAAVRASNRIVQVGYQQRSYPHFLQAKQLIDSGGIGKVTQVLTWWNQNYATRRTPPAVDVARLDWNQFLGNACSREFDPWRFTSWRWFWDYGGGTMTDLFSHWIDSVHWVMGDSVPLEACGQGSKYQVAWFEAPDTVNVSFLYPKQFQVSYVSTMVTQMEDGGILFRGTEGSLRLLRPFFEVYPESGKFDRKTSLPPVSQKVEATRDGTVDHVLNWLDCIKTRKQPNAPVESSVDAANAAHWGNEAIRSGRSLSLPARVSAARKLFNGANLEGWVEDTPNVWQARDGMIVGRHAGQKWNDFLRTRDAFQDFELTLEFRLLNGEGNSGVQFRSVNAVQAHELSGYQADIGQNYWGCLYDESRRNRVLAQAPAPAIAKLDRSGWHTYAVRALGNHITITLDGMRTVDYTEAEPGINQRGIIALQVHSGPGIEVHFRNIEIRELA
ncbi:MAG TPA: family 16 glycoside hydrolase [Paludibaculum sp.]